MEIILDHVYEYHGDTYYSVVECDNRFIDMKTKLLTAEELAVESAGCNRCDFKIEDGVLKYNPMLRVITMDDQLFQKLRYGTNETNGPSDGTLYNLLVRGVNERYVFLDGDLEHGWCNGQGVAYFSSIKFSHSTMSVYVPLVQSAGCYNKMIVQPEDSTLKFIPFKFGVANAETYIPGCHSLNRQVMVNNESYWLWETDELSVYDGETWVLAGLINQCEADSVVYSSCLVAIQDHLDSLTQSEPLSWAGSEASYASAFGVYFTSSCKKLSTSVRQKIENSIYATLMAGGSEDDAIKKTCAMLRETKNLTRTAVYTTHVLTRVAAQATELSKAFEAGWSAKEQLKSLIFWCNLYTYRVRTLVYLVKYDLSQQPLTGGNTVEFTSARSYFGN